jgi:putative oxidoreductase
MPAFMTRFGPQTHALLRIVTGLLFFCHGGQKLLGWPVPMPPEFQDQMNALAYTAGVIEIVGGPLVMVGLFTRWTAFICSGQMAVAYWLAHGPKALFPIENGGELAVLYCFVFLFFSAHGAGIWSVDAARAAK